MNEFRVMGAVEQYLHATYHVQNPALKSVIEIYQLVMDDKLFFFHRAVFELAQSLQDSKASDLNCLYEAQKEASAIWYVS